MDTEKDRVTPPAAQAAPPSEMWMADSRPLLAEIANLAKERDEANEALAILVKVRDERDALRHTINQRSAYEWKDCPSCGFRTHTNAMTFLKYCGACGSHIGPAARVIEDTLFAMIQRINSLGYAGEIEIRREIKETLVEYKDFFHFAIPPEVPAHG